MRLTRPTARRVPEKHGGSHPPELQVLNAIPPPQVSRAKAQLKASLLLGLDGTTAVAEDIGRQIVTSGRRLAPQEIEAAVDSVSVGDVMRVAKKYLWDKDIAVAAVGRVEGLQDYSRVRFARRLRSNLGPVRVS